MPTKPARLGRGLDALFSNSNDDSSEDRLTILQLSAISPGKYQPRQNIDEESLIDLANSIRAHGVIQPIVVREVEFGNFELIAGERRWRASSLAGLSEIPALVKDISDNVALAMAIIENIQRQDLDPIEEAQGLARLIKEFSMTHDQVASAIGRSRSSVSNLLRLLNLAEPVQQLLHEKRIGMGHARPLIALPEITQIDLAQQAAEQGWSVREIERKSKQPITKQKATSEIKNDPDISRLAQIMSENIGSEVVIKHSKKGGRLNISYSSLGELEGLLQRLLPNYQKLLDK